MELTGKIDKKSVTQLAMGAIEERVDYEMGKVIDNIVDPNTKAVAKRKITLTLELTPDDDRKMIKLNASAKSALVPTNPVGTALYITADNNGEMAIVEMTPQIPGQTDIYGKEQEQPKIVRFAQRA